MQIEKTSKSMEVVSCNLCGSEEYLFIYKARDDRFKCSNEYFNVVECKKCGLGFANQNGHEKMKLEQIQPFMNSLTGATHDMLSRFGESEGFNTPYSTTDWPSTINHFYLFPVNCVKCNQGEKEKALQIKDRIVVCFSKMLSEDIYEK